MTDYSEALRYARGHNVVLPDEFYMMDLDARANAATISRLASLDQISHVLELVNKSLESGSTFDDFKKLVKESGIDLPEHHLANVYRTNMQNAYAHGRWVEQQANKDLRPYLQYSSIVDSRTRPTHLAFNNIIRHIDDDFWKKYYPPNGFQCRCTTRSLSEKAANRIGITPDDELSELPVSKYDWDYHPSRQATHLNDVINSKLDNAYLNHNRAQALLKIKDDAVVQQEANQAVKGVLSELDQQNKKHLDDFLSQNNIEPSSPRIIFEFTQDEEELTGLAQEALVRKSHDKKANSIWSVVVNAFNSMLSRAKSLKNKLTGNNLKGFDTFNLQKGNVIGIQTPTLFKTAEQAGKNITILDMKGHAIDLSKINGLNGSLLAPDLNLEVVSVTDTNIVLKRTDEVAKRLFVANGILSEVACSD